MLVVDVYKMSLFLFGVGVLFSQFYVFKSGMPQPSHLLMVLPFFFFMLKKRKIHINVFGGPEPAALLFFLFYAIFINLVFGLLRGEAGFILASLHLAYGVFLFILFQNIVSDFEVGIKYITNFIFCGILLLFILSIFGLGGYKFYPRYNAYFNDPNQMAFWVLCMSSMILVQAGINNTVKSLVFVFLFFVILKSASRSGIVGFSILVFGYLLSNFDFSKSKISPQRLTMVFIGFMLVIGLGVGVANYNADALKHLEHRIYDVDIGGQAEIRGYTRFVDFPEYVFLGSGQGDESRFNESSTEMHSTWAGLLFYYGFPGLGIMLFVIYSISCRMPLSQKLIFFAPLLYSFSTLGFRTPVFWVFLSFFYCYSKVVSSVVKKNQDPGSD